MKKNSEETTDKRDATEQAEQEKEHGQDVSSDMSKDTSEQAQQPETSELEACLEERAAWEDKYLRLRAEFENFTRRMEKERTQLAQLGQLSVLTDFLTIVDDLDRALAEHKEENLEDEKKRWLAGFELINASIYKLLEKYSVRPMAQDLHEVFDPIYHEAVMQVDSADHESGAIVQILQQGFMLNDQVLRPAKVSVAK